MIYKFFFGIILTIIVYILLGKLNKIIKTPLLNPVLMSILALVYLLIKLDISYEYYNFGGKWITFFLGPVTVMFAIPIYKQLPILKKHWVAILTGVTSGVVTSFIGVYLFSILFDIEESLVLSLFPKSITTPMGVATSEAIGGIVSITIVSIIITGVSGYMSAPIVCKLFKIHHPVARGIAIGCSSHALGTTKAFEMGELEGAMSSLSIGVTGIITVILVPIMLKFIS